MRAAGAGSFAMKVSARPFLRRFGFRRILIGNGVISGVSILACAFFTPSTPVMAIFAVLLVGGFFRSLQFTAFNTIAYADIGTAKISAATVKTEKMISPGVRKTYADHSLRIRNSVTRTPRRLGRLGCLVRAARFDFVPAGTASVVATCVTLPIVRPSRGRPGRNLQPGPSHVESPW